MAQGQTPGVLGDDLISAGELEPLARDGIGGRTWPMKTSRNIMEFEVGDLRMAVEWAAITLTAALSAGIAVGPTACKHVEGCVELLEAPWNPLSSYTVCALVTALSLELTSLRLTWRSAKPLVGIVRGIEYTFVPPVLLCVAFAVLIMENLFIGGFRFVHAGAPGVGGMMGRPVFSSIYAEWLITVPILLALSGKFALQRPLAEVSRPLVVTNIYIVISWAAHFIDSALARWAMIFIAFAMYIWASIDMVGWVHRFRGGTPVDLPARDLRCALTLGLIFVFFVYGMTYLAAFTGKIASHLELSALQMMNAGAKLGMLMGFVGIRQSQIFDLMVDLLLNKATPFERQQAVMDNYGEVEQPSSLPTVV